MISKSVRAKFSGGVLVPQETLDLEEGENVILSIAGPPAERPVEALRASAGAWKGTHEPEALKERIYSNRRTTSRPRPRL